ncbi:MAG: hypothetical protein ACPH5P_00260 [Akkermansiaceae bacterium]
MNNTKEKVDPRFTLLNCAELAEIMGVKNSFIYKMKRAGMPMPGGKTTLEECMAWRNNNPEYTRMLETR